MIVRSNISGSGWFVTGALLIAMTASVVRADADDRCWPQGHPEYPVGSPDAVVSKASDFLLHAEGAPEHPYWPGGKSGITIGVGWDLGYHTVADLRESWQTIDADALSHLEMTVGKRGAAAHALVAGLAMATVPRPLSLRVLNASLKNYYRPLVVKLFPGTEKLPVEAHVVLISLVFNRGDSMGRDPDWLTAVPTRPTLGDAEDARRRKARRHVCDVRAFRHHETLVGSAKPTRPAHSSPGRTGTHPAAG